MLLLFELLGQHRQISEAAVNCGYPHYISKTFDLKCASDLFHNLCNGESLTRDKICDLELFSRLIESDFMEYI